MELNCSIVHILSNSFINGLTIAGSLVTSAFSKFPKNADLVQFMLPDIKILLSIITNLWCIKTSNCFDFGLMPANRAMMSTIQSYYIIHLIGISDYETSPKLNFSCNYICFLKCLSQTCFDKVYYLTCIILCHGLVQYHPYDNLSIFGFYNCLC